MVLWRRTRLPEKNDDEVFDKHLAHAGMRQVGDKTVKQMCFLGPNASNIMNAIHSNGNKITGKLLSVEAHCLGHCLHAGTGLTTSSSGEARPCLCCGGSGGGSGIAMLPRS